MKKRILLVFKCFCSYMSHWLPFKQDIFVSFPIWRNISIKHLHRIDFELFSERVLILFISFDSIDLFLQSLKGLVPSLLLSHLCKSLFSLWVPLEPPLFCFLAPAVTDQEIIDDVLRVRIYIVLFRHKSLRVFFIKIPCILNFSCILTSYIRFSSLSILFNFGKPKFRMLLLEFHSIHIYSCIDT